ncbi:MAG: PAS domain-containing protein [Proteobacteria bacterium]|nr:PAS domain-containing protein [Pseudomonadota bacterium]
MDKDHFHLILEVATEGYWDWNLKNDVAYLSPRYCELVGYSPEDTVFDSHFFKSIIHPDDCDYFFKTIEGHLHDKSEIAVIEYRMVSKSGAIIWIEGRCKTVEYDEQGVPSRMVGTIIDITKRKQVDENVFDVMSKLPDIIVARFDRSLRHQYVSSSIEKITGYPKDYFIGKSNKELGMPENLVIQWDDAIREVFETGQLNKIEFRYPSPEGPKYFSTELTAEHCVDGLITNVICATRDITEHRKTEEDLRKSEYFFKESQRAATIGSYHADFIAGKWESSEVLDAIFGIDSDYNRSIRGWIDIIHADD